MASIVLRLDERINKNGMSPVRVRISHQHTAAWYQTGVMVEPSCFQRDSVYDPVSKKAYMAAEKREQLAAIVRRWDEGLFELQRADDGLQLENMTAKELRDYIYGTHARKKKVVRRKVNMSDDFLSWFDSYGQSRASDRTREHFAYVWRILYAYKQDRGISVLTFADITYERLTDLKQWVRQSGRGEPTRFKIESYVRAAYREGIRMGKCHRDADPFYYYRIERVPLKDIVTISREQMHRLMTADLSIRPGLERSRDVLLASFYLCGVNFVDLFNMPAPVDGEVVFVRHKVQRHTQMTTRIRVEPELATIYAKYGGEGRLLNFKTNMRSLQYRLDDNYRALSDVLGFKVTMEIIRRTWATLAGELECPEIVIDKSMGHVVRTVNGRFYESYDWGRTAKWNRRVIDYVKYNEAPIE